MTQFQVLHQVEPVRFFKCEVDDGEIRLDGINEFERMVAVLRLAADQHVGLGVDDIGETFTHHWMVVHEENFCAKLAFGLWHRSGNFSGHNADNRRANVVAAFYVEVSTNDS